MRYRILFFRLLFPVMLLIVGALILHTPSDTRPPPPMIWDQFSAHSLTAEIIDAKGQRMPAQALMDAKRIVLYFSANSNPAGKEFSPKLIDFYQKNGGGKAFQVLFITRDKDYEEEVGASMRDANMPWWGAHTFAARKISNAYPGAPIPGLIVLDNDGRVLADSREGGMDAALAAIAD